jgi:transposase-like protein
MPQHFLLSAKARTLSLASVLRMTDEQAETAFIRIRWAATEGKPVCVHCECPTVWDCRKANGLPRWRCKACRKSFSITSGTIFASRKMPLRNYLAAIAIFVNEVKGKSALALSRDLGCQYKSAYVLAHKLREAMASELKGLRLGGPGRVAEVDGGYFGGYVKPSNRVENRRDRRLAKNQNGKRQVVVVVREREGRTLPAVFKSESAALGFIARSVAKDTQMMADEAPSWNGLHARFAMQRIDHQAMYSDRAGVYTNGADRQGETEPEQDKVSDIIAGRALACLEHVRKVRFGEASANFQISDSDNLPLIVNITVSLDRNKWTRHT